MGEKVASLLEEAWGILRRALEEFEEAVGRSDNLGIRDAAEKAWNAVVQATNALLLKAEGVAPSSHYERRRYLRELERKVKAVEDLALADRYMARNRALHGEAFYEGIIDVEGLRIELRKVAKYIGDVERMLEQMA